MVRIVTAATIPVCRCGNTRCHPTYWGEYLCEACALAACRTFDGARWWPGRPWDADRIGDTPGPVAVLDHSGWRQHDGRCWPWARAGSIAGLGELCAAMRVRQVWVHASALDRLGWEAMPAAPEGWRTGGAHGWGNYWRDGKTGKTGFELCVPAWGDGPFAECSTGAELADELGRFVDAMGGALWHSSGAITSERMLKQMYRGRDRRLRIRATVHPPPAMRGARGQIPAGEEPNLRWWRRREFTAGERRARYCHAFDLHGMFLAAASSVALPAGAVEHHQGAELRARLGELDRRPGYWLIEPPAGDEPLPPILGRRPAGPVWVTTPTFRLVADRGPVAALEAYTWPEHHQYLRPWYERLRDARTALLGHSGPAAAAVKETYSSGIGRLGSPTRLAGLDDPLFQPYWRHAVIGEARSRLWARLARAKRPPVAVDVDCVWWLSSHQDPAKLADELGLRLGAGLGEWAHISTIPGPLGRELLSHPAPIGELKAAGEA